MADDLLTQIAPAKLNALVALLDNKRPKAALAAEAELSLLWAISRVAHIEVEPKLPNSSHRPDVFSRDLFVSTNCVVEIRALSDDSFSGQEAMDHTAEIVANYADRFQKRASDHLYFEFADRSYWDTKFRRERCVDPNFELSCSARLLLRDWIRTARHSPPAPLRISEGKTNVLISWRPSVSKHARTFCSMPPVAYDLEKNPIYTALKKKRRQVSGASQGTLRCIFLFDAGCSLLRHLKPTMMGTNEISGAEIIHHALRKLSVDLVCVFSPSSGNHLPYSSSPRWKVTCFDKRENMDSREYHRLNELSSRLPAPQFEGYQARSIHAQGGFHPQKSWYLGTKLTTGLTTMTISLSSRLLQDYLAGRIDKDTYEHHAFGDMKNPFEAELSGGLTIQAVKFESGGLDDDDDHIVFDLALDPGAGRIQ
ncbi:hypothetical protein [Parvibaculum sp.]|uniref:hypothetical protein n=1 Tax=Parvibaculum sp. TaxID=2024848 RepID=UPI001DB7CA68|nr:hypothetical protein [Parvibaculum sp.]MBX3491041.1 hypothetical protein [Parvibaculum sp.]MCW5728861.1 hypothetical protein [Parvibaculum sp.]